MKAFIACVALLGLGVPVVASAYQVFVCETILIASIGALGLNLLTGSAGQISIGHAAFLGVGAFTSAGLVSRAGLPFWMSVPAAGAAAAAVGLLFGLPSVRIKGLYLAIATLCAQVIIQWLLSRPFLAGGGSLAAPRPEIIRDDRAYYYVVLALSIAAALLAHTLLRTRIGRALSALRDREVAASAIGIDVARYKLMAFGISSFYAGVAGALLAHLGQAANYEQFQFDVSIQYLAMIVIGGLGSVPGSVLGAAFVSLVPLLLRGVLGPIDGSAELVSSAQVLLFGLIVVLCMAIEPHGLVHVPWRILRLASV